MLGIFLGFVAALGFGSSTVLARVGLQHMRSSSATIISLISGSVTVLILAFALSGADILALPFTAFLWFALIGLVHFVMGRFLNFTSVSLAGAAKASALFATSPLFAATFAVTLGGETLTLPVVLGTLSIIAGVILVVTKS